jgi:hypothetical protein
MRVDEAGRRDHRLADDDLGAGRFDSLADRDDGAVAHVDIAALDIAELVVHGQQIGAANEVFAAGRQMRIAGRR